MNVLAGSTDVTTYFVLRLAATGVEATGLTITNFDLQYTRSGVAPVAKVDATALAATDTAHTDNTAIEIDATDQPGLYRVDWPDAAFASGVREVILTVKCAACFTEHLRVNLTPVPVDLQTIKTQTITCAAPVVILASVGTAATSTAQTGDNFARIGAAGAGLTNISLPAAGLANVTAWAVAITGNITGNLSGSVGSVTGAVGSVTGAVGSVTAIVSANVTKVNGITIDGAGTTLDPWGPA